MKASRIAPTAPPAPELRKILSIGTSTPRFALIASAMYSRSPGCPCGGGYLARSTPSPGMMSASADTNPSTGIVSLSVYVTENVNRVSSACPGGISTVAGKSLLNRFV